MNESKLKELLEQISENMKALKDALELHEHLPDGIAVSRTVIREDWEPRYNNLCELTDEVFEDEQKNKN